LRCYAPRMSVIVTLLVVGFLALRHTAGRALAGGGLITTGVIVLGGCLFAAAVMVISAATIRHRRAAAGACLTCRHPCQEEVLLARGTTPGTPDWGDQSPQTPLAEWPHRPLSRAALPVIIVPRQSPSPEAGRTRERELTR
jgi:hypothetical protein